MASAFFFACHLSSDLFSQEEEPETIAAAAAEELPSDDAIIERLPEFSTDYVSDLLGIYARLKNEKMVTALTGELRRRDPDKKLPQSDAELANQAMDLGGGPPTALELFENKVDALVVAKKYQEAVVLLEKERASTYQGKPFPLDVDLGDIYATLGNLAAAQEAYTRAAANQESTELQKSRAALGLATIEKLEAIESGYALIKEKKNKEALVRATEVRDRYPDEPEAQLLYAQALVPNYHYMEALPMLESIKAKHFKGLPFPGTDALAECLRAVGRFDDALIAYQELTKDMTVPAHVRNEAIVGAREVSRMRTGTFHGDAEFVTESEGDGFLGETEVSTPISPQSFAGFRAWAYSVDLSEERSIRRSSGSFLGAVAYGRHYFDDRLSYLEARAGGGEHNDLTWGITYGRQAPYVGTIGYEISVDANVPSLDSLQLIALNGVEDKVSGSVTVPLPNRFELFASAWGRRVKADGAELGDGWGAYVEIGRPIWENATETKQLYLAFQGTYDRFDAKRLSTQEVSRLGYDGAPANGRYLGAELVETRYHPNGLHLTYEAQINNQVFFWTGGGLFFDFSDDEWDYNYSLGLDWSWNDSLSFIIEGGYYSDGVGVSAEDSDALIGSLSWRGYF